MRSALFLLLLVIGAMAEDSSPCFCGAPHDHSGRATSLLRVMFRGEDDQGVVVPCGGVIEPDHSKPHVRLEYKGTTSADASSNLLALLVDEGEESSSDDSHSAAVGPTVSSSSWIGDVVWAATLSTQHCASGCVFRTSEAAKQDGPHTVISRLPSDLPPRRGRRKFHVVVVKMGDVSLADIQGHLGNGKDVNLSALLEASPESEPLSAINTFVSGQDPAVCDDAPAAFLPAP